MIFSLPAHRHWQTALGSATPDPRSLTPPMLNNKLKDAITRRILPRVQTPAQYVGGELNMVRKDHRAVRGKLCLAFPDTYTIGMSHHGLQVLYTLMNNRADWACERAFTPWADMERLLREAGLPLYSLETFTPLSRVRRPRLHAAVRDLLRATS